MTLNPEDATLDAQSRSHITRKLRNKLGGSPPPSSYGGYTSGNATAGASLPATVVPVPNPNSLSVDELPSPFPLPLTASAPSSGYINGSGGQKRKAKGGGMQPMALTGLGKAIQQLTTCKELEIDSDLIEIRRSAKRKRAAASGQGIKT
jgi:hypothetical protein